MTAQKGKDLLLKLDATGGGSFVPVAGLRANRLSFNADSVDITTSESTGHWRECAAGKTGVIGLNNLLKMETRVAG